MKLTIFEYEGRLAIVPTDPNPSSHNVALADISLSKPAISLLKKVIKVGGSFADLMTFTDYDTGVEYFTYLGPSKWINDPKDIFAAASFDAALMESKCKIILNPTEKSKVFRSLVSILIDEKSKHLDKLENLMTELRDEYAAVSHEYHRLQCIPE